MEVQFGRYQKNILQEWSMVKKLSCVSCGSLKRFPHTFTIVMLSFRKTEKGKAIEEISSKGGKRALILWNFCKMSKQLPLVNVRTCNSGFAANFLFYLCSLWKVSFIICFHEGVTRLLSPIRILLFLPYIIYFIWNCSGFRNWSCEKNSNQENFKKTLILLFFLYLL